MITEKEEWGELYPAAVELAQIYDGPVFTYPKNQLATKFFVDESYAREANEFGY